MASDVIGRRTVLRGIGGVALALPALEIMGWSRFAHAAPQLKKKFVSVFSGGSLGDSPAAKGGNGRVHPVTLGMGYETTTALSSLDKYKVKSLVGIVTGLRIPYGENEAGSRVYVGTGEELFHGQTVFPQLSGEKNRNAILNPEVVWAPKGSTCDQIVAARLGAKMLHARIQPVEYHGIGGGRDFGKMSSLKGVLQSPYSSPRTIYDTFISNFQGAAAGSSAPPSREILEARARRKSVLDLVRGSLQQVTKRLGAADALTMQSHLEFVRQIEKDLDAIDLAAGSAACKVPTDPGADPVIANGQAGWSGETLRAKAMVDLLALGLACDLWQVATLQVSFSQIFISAKQAVGVETDLDIHELGHQAAAQKTPDDVARCTAWGIDPFARLVSLLAAQKDVDGSPMINNTALTMCFEGGWERGVGGVSHTTENMIALYAGLAGGLKPQHVRQEGDHPARVLYSAMKAVGVTDALGDFSAPIPGMFA
jgi:Protein of unknown function (DUF1552)